MLRPGSLSRLGAGVVLAVVAALGTAGCVLAPVPEPVVVGPPVIVGPRPVIIAPHPYRGYYRGGYHRGWR